MRAKERFICSLIVGGLLWALTVIAHNIGFHNCAAIAAILVLATAYDIPCEFYGWLKLSVDENFAQYPAIIAMILSVSMAAALCAWIVAGPIAACAIGFVTIAEFVCIIVACWHDSSRA